MSRLARAGMNLPEGVTARPLTDADLDATVAMVNACELHDTGELMLERADTVADAGAASFDPERDWVARSIVATRGRACRPTRGPGR